MLRSKALHGHHLQPRPVPRPAMQKGFSGLPGSRISMRARSVLTPRRFPDRCRDRPPARRSADHQPAVPPIDNIGGSGGGGDGGGQSTDRPTPHWHPSNASSESLFPRTMNLFSDNLSSARCFGVISLHFDAAAVEFLHTQNAAAVSTPASIFLSQL